MFKKYCLIVSVVFFILGLALSFYFEVFNFCPAFICFILFLFFLLLLIKFKKLYLLIFVFLFLGIWRYEIFLNYNNFLENENYYNKDLIISGEVIADPEMKKNSQKIKLRIYEAKDVQENYFKIKGKILISTNSYPVYRVGDFLEIKGKYLEAGLINGFDYGLYLKRFGISAVSYYPKIKKIEDFKNKKILVIFKSKIYFLKNKFREAFDSNLSPEPSVILKAMVLGDKSFLSSELRDSFSRSGLSHIIAISGLHITLLSSLLFSFLLFLGISRKQAFYFNVLFLIVYLFLIGAPASACRASLMGFLSFLSLYLGRAGDLSRTLFFAAIILLLINPLLIFVDIGFQLSFLAVLGIIYIYPVIKDFLRKIIFKKFLLGVGENILDIISITISVQLISTPILISNFNQISLIAPISNLLVLWTVPIIISSSIIALLVFFVCPFFSQVLFFLVEIILKYLIFVNDIINKFFFSAIWANNWSTLGIVFYYLFLFYIFIIKKRGLLRTSFSI